MDKIPFEEQRIIDELIEFSQTHHRSPDLFNHIDKLPGVWGRHRARNFFRQVYDDLRTNKHSKYYSFSAPEFGSFLEASYYNLAQTDAERVGQENTELKAKRQAQKIAKRRAQEKAEAERQAQEREEHERRARAEFNALGKEMEKATTRAELVELGRKRTALARYTGASYYYSNHCWRCRSDISSDIQAQCPICRYYICGSCDACLCGTDWAKA